MPSAAVALVVRVQRDQRAPMPKCASSERVTRVSSAATTSHARERLQRAGRDVAEVPDGRGHHI